MNGTTAVYNTSHDLVPLGVQVVEECFNCLVGVAKVVFVKFLHVLFFHALDDALDANGGYGLLEIKLFLESLPFILEGEDIVGA